MADQSVVKIYKIVSVCMAGASVKKTSESFGVMTAFEK